MTPGYDGSASLHKCKLQVPQSLRILVSTTDLLVAVTKAAARHTKNRSVLRTVSTFRNFVPAKARNLLQHVENYTDYHSGSCTE
ncbi:hypothetical protein OS493_013280 [Desmophyllum pertusum]|uniref:Uncharacterized protein n=1 Tax=Desmophyllum pertusum TaxID=174260 RepID=A0A9X0CN97_9CNID|nr:hypothetical protein OS493_013280 [Desmophyllum pertusum]